MFARFDSFYCTRKLSVDTDLEQQAPSLLLKDASCREKLNKLVQEKPIRHHLEHPVRDERSHRALESLGWRYLSPSVFGHPDIGNWLIKTNYGDEESAKEFSGVNAGKFDNLQRPLMGRILRKGAVEAGLDLAVPNEYLVPIPNATTTDLRGRFFVVSEKLELNNDRLIIWKDLYQKGLLRETIQKIFLFITLTGYADASLGNICFTSQGRLSVVDTEAIGLLRDVREVSGAQKREEGMMRLSRCAFAGLQQFLESFKSHLVSEAMNAERLAGSHDVYLAERAKTKSLLDLVEEEVKAAKERVPSVLANKKTLKKVHAFSKSFNWCLIISSIFIPIIPIILLIESAIHKCRSKT